MAFSAADILAEFVEAAGASVESQRWLDFDGCRVSAADERRWDTAEERERDRKRRAAMRARPMSKRKAMRYAVRFNWRHSLRPAKAALAALREQRRAKRCGHG